MENFHNRSSTAPPRDGRNAEPRESSGKGDEVGRALKKRPSLSIRTRITVSYSMLFLLCVGITVWFYYILVTIEGKIAFLEVTDNYLVEIQQARRFEKNYLLYKTGLDEAIKHLARAEGILNGNPKTIKKIMGEKSFREMSQYMQTYRTQLIALEQASDDGTRNTIVPELRYCGSRMVKYAGEVVKKERASVFYVLKTARRVPFYFIALLLVLVMFLVGMLTRQLLASLNRFMNYTKRIGEGDFSPIMPAKKYKDEFTKLADAFNRMIKELDHRHTVVVESHKLRAVGTLVAGVAHELNNPLNNSMLTAAMLKEDFDTLEDEQKLEMIDDLIRETERSQVIVRGLLDFARESETRIKPLDIRHIILDSARLVSNQIKLAKIRLNLELKEGEDLPDVHGDEQLLQQVFVNLILNAVAAVPAGGNLWISIPKDKIPDFLVVEVKDDGPGIPEHLQTRIFEPFFTTKKGGKGTGLGLSVCRGIVRKLGGYIHLAESSEKGTVFRLSLPITGSPSEMMSGQQKQSPSPAEKAQAKGP